MDRTSVNPPGDWGTTYSMDQGHLITGATRTLYLSGQVALESDPGSELGVRVESAGDMRGQFKHALGRIDRLLEGAGMGRANIVFIRFYSTDTASFLEHYDVYADWIGEAGIMPPQSDIGVGELAVTGLLSEIEVIAAD